ncbi:thrombospondin type-1 domain-containing 7B [Pelobates cultripes]|uniref:Thrombospondin type-1 domain-containing protein 7A n=1 Tax=Pelobates cultripes TaxID=61616 RepID=A0AAD1SNJ8_PELCU|nr:thrombospondin type-1 domain-containing 7B [Pelobates cultripes]
MCLRNALVTTSLSWKKMNDYLLIVTIFISLGKGDLDRKDQDFFWKTGTWGRCVGECGPGGVQGRSVWCIHAEGWVTHNSNCKPKDKPESQRSCFKICDWHKELFQWEVKEWELCFLVPYPGSGIKIRTMECVTAQHGLQHRQVDCVEKANRSIALSEICEYFTPRPPTEQVCLVPCPRDCVVSEFSMWSTCTKRCGKQLQHRTRSVISPALYGGSDCPNLTETRTCELQGICPFGAEEYTYSLKVGPWSECRLPHLKEIHLSGRTMLDFSSDSGERSTFKQESHTFHTFSHKDWNPEIGYQTRQVRCIRSDGKNALLSICIQDNMPIQYQSCIIPKDCEVMEWSAWSACSKTCQSMDQAPGFRSRSRGMKSIAMGGGRQCPELTESEACDIKSDSLPPCPRFFWKTTAWKECRVSLLADQTEPHWELDRVLCGGGTQTRSVFCAQSIIESGMESFEEVYRPVDQKFCVGPMPSPSQLCSIPCSTDCLLSTWSAWGPCVYENCLDYQGRKGLKLRRRHVIVESTGDSGSCPHLVESIPCDDPVCYKWAVSGELHCVPENGECGHGRYQVNTSCQDENGFTVSNELCVDEPPMQLVCKVPCSLDCVISEWSHWSDCSRSCSSKNAEGKQSRMRSILAYPGEDGKSCPSSQSLYEYRLCNSHPCTAFYWETSPWSSCSVNNAIPSLNATVSWNGNASCGVGIQHRKIFCIKSNAGQVTNKRCPVSTRPETIRPCQLDCKKDCVVTLFSEWTPCHSVCRPGNGTFVKQSRYRVVLQNPVNGVQDCPNTLYEERECEDLPICLIYRWKTHPWGQCVLVPDSVKLGIMGITESCGQGLQTRDITCLSGEDQPANLSACFQWAGPMPTMVQECYVPCKDDCTFTSWSKFSACSADCTTSRVRRRTLTGRSKKRERCQNTEFYPLAEAELCPCEVFKSLPYGNWSDCIITGTEREIQLGKNNVGGIKECGEGVRFRATACYDLTGRIVNPALCGHDGSLNETCAIPCPFDCKMSDWSTWSSCSSLCGTGVKIRRRWLKQKPYNEGRSCPKLDIKNQVYEALPCYSECNKYELVSDPWSACKFSSEEKTVCGEGIQIRRVQCVNISENGEDAFVNDTYCNQREIVPTRQKCTLSCPGECVMSNWGQWSECPKGDVAGAVVLNKRLRTRFPLRIPASDKTCPEDSQTEPCILNSNCFHYRYNVTEWSACQLSENAECGEGTRTRLAECIRSDGKPVKMSFCEEIRLEHPIKMSIHCFVECAIDCHLSDWSSWSPCSQTCGRGGQMIRSRQIILQAHGNGRPCPTQLKQYKNCPAYPCYEWSFGEWSKCKVENGQCGEGFKVRNLTCVVHDALPTSSRKQVDPHFCGIAPSGEDLFKLHCSVPCAGDCHLADWSHWSSCELTCIDGRIFEAVGLQSRSRTFIMESLENQENCPKMTTETRSCTGGKCFKYTWKMSPWRDNKRDVWCQRSDGKNVTGGCSLQSQPATVRVCDPPCTKPFSYCMQSGVCGCEQGYTQIMRSNGFLDYCLKVPGTEFKKADVKKIVEKSKRVNSRIPEIFKGWSIQPFDPDGRVKLWVYGVSAGSFLIIVLLILLSYLICKKPKENMSFFPQQKPLSFSYDGDIDM